MWDTGVPARSASAIRTVSIVTPCLKNEFFCPDLLQPCGTSPCSTRSQLLGRSSAARPPPNVEFVNAAMIASQLQHVSPYSGQAPRSLALILPCNTKSSVDLSFCESGLKETSCGIRAEDSKQGVTSSLAIVDFGCAESESTAQNCKLCRLDDATAGRCPVGQYVYSIAAVNSDKDSSDSLKISVRNFILYIHLLPLLIQLCGFPAF